MSDIIDDIDRLLSQGMGDKRILEQIRRAVQHNEAVSVYEKNYVAKLVADPYFESGSSRAVQSSDHPTSGIRGTAGTLNEGAAETTVATDDGRTRQNPHMIKIAAGVGGAVLIAILAIGLSMSGTMPTDLNYPPGDLVIPASGIAIIIDDDSYSPGDIILAYGRTDPSSEGTLTLSITGTDDNLVWQDDVTLKSDGTFSTLILAGGTGWTLSETYTLTAEYGTLSDDVAFTFSR